MAYVGADEAGGDHGVVAHAHLAFAGGNCAAKVPGRAPAHAHHRHQREFQTLGGVYGHKANGLNAVGHAQVNGFVLIAAGLHYQ